MISDPALNNESEDLNLLTADETSKLLKPEKEKLTGHLLLLVMLSAIGGFLFGYDTGVISGAMILLRKEFDLSNFYQELIVSGAIASAAVFAIMSGFLNDLLGRKPVILIASVVFTVGALVMACALGKKVIVFGRIIVGAGVGLASMTVPMYIAESAPPHLRGQLVTMNNFFITSGQFVAGVVDGIFFPVKQGGWRYMLGLAAVPAIFQFVAFLFMPESPRWLIAADRREDARRVLFKLRGVTTGDGDPSERVEKELQEIEETHLAQKRSTESVGSKFRLGQILEQPWTRRALLVGCMLQLIQQLVGINTLMYYTASIVGMAGISDTRQLLWISAAIAGVNMFAGGLGLFLVEKWGRRPLTLASLVGVAVALAVLVIGFQLTDDQAPLVNVREPIPLNQTGIDSCLDYYGKSCLDCISSKTCGLCYPSMNESVGLYDASCLPVKSSYSDVSLYGQCATKDNSFTFVTDHCPSSYWWIIILGLVFYLISFSSGMGPMPWTINSEIYPLWARSTCISCATTVNWVSNVVISLTFLTLTENITKPGTFGLYLGVTILGIMFVAKFLPETRGKRLEEIEIMFVATKATQS